MLRKCEPSSFCLKPVTAGRADLLLYIVWNDLPDLVAIASENSRIVQIAVFKSHEAGERLSHLLVVDIAQLVRAEDKRPIRTIGVEASDLARLIGSNDELLVGNVRAPVPAGKGGVSIATGNGLIIAKAGR